ncbi:hypothetical protein [Rhizomonospora bruguierae]|uniref:hypothetical protein n=1 Tax=Rhizomonospora bruguierae TaxID=1581705 RepID=UPI001BCE32CE|nr:hypothetical protein [Micromonospora sp. NBRC 107566]
MGFAMQAPSRSRPATEVDRLPHLYDLRLVVAPDGGLAHPDEPGRSLAATELATLVRLEGDATCDIRVLVPVDEANLGTVAAMARELGRDALVVRDGCELHIRPRPPDRRAGQAGADHEVVPVDRNTGNLVDWTLVPPAGTTATGPGWFALRGGRVLPREGRATLPLPGRGLVFPGRDDFVEWREAAATLRAGHPRLTTVGVRHVDGHFVLAAYDGRTHTCDGLGLAAALGALPLYRGDLRLWMTWPADPGQRRRLRDHVGQLAAACGAVVWAPPWGGRATILDGCRDLHAVDADGRPGRWEAYGPGATRTFVSDEDGRLMPPGPIAVTSAPGIALVATDPAAPPEHTIGRVASDSAAFRVALPALADGRLALRHSDGTLLAVGPHQLRQLLRRAGWQGGAFTVVTSVAPERVEGTRRHAHQLAQALGCRVHLGDPPATPEDPPSAPVDPPTAPVDPPSAPVEPPWALVDPIAAGPLGPVTAPDRPRARPDDRTAAEPSGPTSSQSDRHRPPAHTATRSTTRPPNPPSGTNGPVGAGAAAGTNGAVGTNAAAGASGAGPGRTDTPKAAGDRVRVNDTPAMRGNHIDVSEAPTMPSRFLDGPRVDVAARSTPRHRLGWLPARPQVNQEEFDVVVDCPEPDRAVREGVPSPRLLLLGNLATGRLRPRHPGGLLRIRVGAGAAVDVAATEVYPPRALAGALASRDVWLLPAAWLDRCRVVAVVRTDPATGRPVEEPIDAPVRLTSKGAAHGVPGLPTEIWRWPRLRRVTRYLTIDPARVDNDWHQLHAARPPAQSGLRLLQVRVERGAAVDVRRTEAALSGLPALRTRLPALRAAGVDHLLPRAAFAAVTVRREFRADGSTWRPVRRPATTLASWRPAGKG